MVASLLNLNRIDDAWKYLNAALEYYDCSSLKYVLPEGSSFPSRESSTELGRRAQEQYEIRIIACRKIAPWIYSDDEKLNKIYGMPVNFGNLIHMTYYLFVVDLICGIAHCRDGCGLCVFPKVPSSWPQLSVRNYQTRFGTISYTYKRDGEKINMVLDKPGVDVEVTLGPFAKKASLQINGKNVDFKTYSSDDRLYARLNVSAHEFSVQLQANS